MANTYTQLYIHLVFAVSHRKCLIEEPNRQSVEKYMCGTVAGLGSKVVAIYCNPDHCHALVSCHPTQSVSDIAKTMKSMSSKWINERQITKERFSWQTGFGAFTCEPRQKRRLVDYILNQYEHHRNKSFSEEYIEFLKSAHVDFDPRYIFTSVI